MPYDFASVQKQLSGLTLHSARFRLVPANLAGLTLPVPLNWQYTRFDAMNARAVSEEPGVYAFAIAHPQPGLPPHNYVLYIGEAGAKKGSGRTLRARFKDYLREKTRGKRTNVAYFLNAWETCLVFYFATIDPRAANLLDIEKRLNDAMIPPFSRGDFSADIRASKKLAEAL